MFLLSGDNTSTPKPKWKKRERARRSLCAVKQFHSDASLEAVDRRARKSWQWTTEGDHRHLLRMALNDRTASSRQLAARWSIATSVLMTASSIRRHLLHRGLRARVLLYRMPLTANHRRCISFNLPDHDGRIRVRRYAGERCLPGCVIERHSGLTSGVMVWGVISFHGRSNLLRIEGNLNSNSCQVIYSQFGLAIHQNDHQARSRFVEWAQNEIAVVPNFHKRILFSDEAHFWLNGYVNKQNCRIWSEANPQVYVETPLHPEKLTGALYGLVESFFKNDEGHNVTVNGDRYRAMITNFFIPELNNHDVQEPWFQQDGATCHTARATIDLLKDTFGDRLISRFGPVN
ncbi:transposable element Tc1 transposase [Trichonephila clavipes]|nr:transposable element Tc1 transposase [Trichonephila clavipes]